MSMRMRGVLLALAVAVPVGASAQVDAVVGSIQEVPFGTVSPNPTGIRMYYYVPADATAPMPVVVGLHGCQGQPEGILVWLKAQADEFKFMLALPDANRVDGGAPSAENGCWDSGSADTFATPSNSDPAGIMALVEYLGTTLQCGGEACGDLENVFATGQSSGAMMTNVLIGHYPDAFKAGASIMGVPYACWAEGVGGSHPTPGTGTASNQRGGAAGWSNACATGTVTHTGSEWADLLPDDGGQRPRMLIWHGESDNLISYVNFAEQVKQWTTALGADTEMLTDMPFALANSSTSPPGWTRRWTRTRYGDASAQAPVETISAADTGHEVPNAQYVAAEVVRFFGLGDSSAPTVPETLAASDVGAGGATLTWDASTDDQGVTHYVVYRVEGETLTAIAWPTASPFDLRGLTPSTSYTLRIAAADLAGNLSAPSDEGEAVSFTTTADTTAPEAPTGLAAQNVTTTGARLRWGAATDDVAVTGYVISRQEGSGWVEVATQTATTLTLTGLQPSTAYTYRVIATDAAAHESAPASVTFTTLSDGGGGGGGGGGCGQGVPAGGALLLAAAALFLVRRRTSRV